MNRDPRTMILDIKARLAASRIAERRIKDLVENKGSDFFVGALRRILSITSEAAKKRVKKLNDGVFRQPRFMDTVGMEPGLTKINITMQKKDDKVLFNFDDSSPLLMDKPLNSFFQGVVGLIMVYFCGWLFYDLPANNGLLDALDWEFPENSFINAKGEVPTSLSPFTQTCAAHGVFLAGARMTYHLDQKRAVAGWFQGFGVPLFGGVNQWGEPMADITPEINATGCGARPDKDGVDGSGAWFATMSDCSDVETTESDRPFVYLFRNYFKNSYGHGKFRGGAGVGFGVMMHHVPWVALGSFGYGSKIPSTLGIFGGYAVPPTFIQTVRQSSTKELLQQSNQDRPGNLDDVYQENNPEQGQKEVHHITMPVQPFVNGDTFFVPVGGGAGYGDPLERDPEAVLKDLKENKTTEFAAQNIYKIVYDPNTYRLDPKATDELRAQFRKDRIANAQKFDDFEAQWNKLKPPAEILNSYGNYPHPSEEKQTNA